MSQTTTFPIISLVGPTATGKSAAAEQIGQQLLANPPAGLTGIDYVAADSRQVYKGLEIVSGADLPAGAEQMTEPGLDYLFWERGAERWHGLSCIEAEEEWSVAHFQALAHQVVAQAQTRGRLVMIVGGTGLYHEHIWTDQPHIQVSPNWALRHELQSLTTRELQARLEAVSRDWWQSLNASDRANPRRLIRAIELATAGLSRSVTKSVGSSASHPMHVTFGLTDQPNTLQAKIQARVEARLAAGAAQEVARLVAQAEAAGEKWPALSATGVKELQAFLAGEASEVACLEAWSRREWQYAKRQLTWWKKHGQVEWLSVAEPNWQLHLWQSIQKLLY